MPTDASTTQQQTLFSHAGSDFYRIPGLLTTRDGTLLAFCQHRKESISDFGHDSDGLLRRSTDGGKTWSEPKVLATKNGVDIHTGPVVQNRATGRIHKFYRYWPAESGKQVVQNTTYAEMRQRGLIDHVVHSDDDGETWSEPRPITLPFPDDATHTGVGNGIHGIQLANGDLAIAAGYCDASGAMHNVVLLSDDGETWRIGARDPRATSAREFIFAPLHDQYVYCNFRDNNFRDGTRGDRRLASWAPADLTHFGEIREDDDLPEPVAHAGVNVVPPNEMHEAGVLLFSNPNVRNLAGRFDKNTRRKMTVRASLDGGVHWPHALELWSGPAAYSDLEVTQTDGEWFVHVLYEQGDDHEEHAHYSKRLVHATLPLAHLLDHSAEDFPPEVMNNSSE